MGLLDGMLGGIVGAEMATVLPEAVDKLTPGWQLPPG